MGQTKQKIDRQVSKPEHEEVVHLNSPEIKKELEEENDFERLFEESLKGFEEGKVVEGQVIEIDEQNVLVDIGFKSEGRIPVSEFLDTEGNLTVRVGDKVTVLLIKKENELGDVLLSKKKAEVVRVWDRVRALQQNGETISGRIVSRVKGGFSVDIGVKAFLPGSHLDFRPVRDISGLLGTEQDFKIIKYNQRRGDVVLSRKAVLEEQREKALEEMQTGAVVEGSVKNIAEYGLFVDLGPIDGFVHVTEISWRKVGHPSEMYQVGDKVKVKVLEVDRKRKRVTLGIKQLTPDPWNKAAEKYPVGSRVEGKVTGLTNYGAFVELEEGVEGMIHVSEMSWSKMVHRPSQMMNLGDTVDAVVLDVDMDAKRISLGMKQLETNPWDTIAERYPVGSIIEGSIKSVRKFGIFIGLDEGIDGLVHLSDLSWKTSFKHPSELYKKGQVVQAVVLDINKESQQVSLGIKQLSGDPWEAVPRKYKPGMRVTGKVVNITEFGVFVELEEGVEGLIHVSEMAEGEEKEPLSQFQRDQVIETRIVSISPRERKIGLSIRRLEQGNQKDLHSGKEAVSNLGDILRDQMMSLEQR